MNYQQRLRATPAYRSASPEHRRVLEGYFGWLLEHDGDPEGPLYALSIRAASEVVAEVVAWWDAATDGMPDWLPRSPLDRLGEHPAYLAANCQQAEDLLQVAVRSPGSIPRLVEALHQGIDAALRLAADIRARTRHPLRPGGTAEPTGRPVATRRGRNWRAPRTG